MTVKLTLLRDPHLAAWLTQPRRIEIGSKLPRAITPTMGERSTFGEPLEMMAKGALLVLPSKVESTCHGRSIPTEAIPRRIRLAKRALRWPRCSHSAHSEGSGRDSVLEKDIWSYLQHLATFAASSSRPLKLTTSASCICFHTSSRRSAQKA